MSNKVKKGGGINLAQGIPGIDPPYSLVNALKQVSDLKIHQYAPGTGNYELVELLNQKYNHFNNYKTENFLITNGATEAISLIYTYLNRKHKHLKVAAFEPYYETYKKLPEIFSDEFYPLVYEDDYAIDFTKMEKNLKENNINLLFISSPGNPLGKILHKEDFDKIISIVRKLDIYLIIDAVYREIVWTDSVYIPFKDFTEKVFYVNSFSKLFSITGWRLGYMLMHENMAHEMGNLHDYIGLSSPSVLQQALVQFIKTSNFGETYLRSINSKIKDSYQLMSDELMKNKFKVAYSEGGYFIWAKLPASYSEGLQFAEDFYNRQKVAVVPGEHFSPKYKNYIRLNVAHPASEIHKAIKALRVFMETSEKQLFYNKITSVKARHC